jgi:hypothetical protein
MDNFLDTEENSTSRDLAIDQKLQSIKKTLNNMGSSFNPSKNSSPARPLGIPDSAARNTYVSNYVLYDSKMESPALPSEDISLTTPGGQEMLRTYENEHVAVLEKRIM